MQNEEGDLGRPIIGEDLQQPLIYPATTLAVMQILQQYKVEGKDQRAVVFGNSYSVGRPIINLLRTYDFEVSEVDENTLHPESKLQEADLVVTAVGKSELIDASLLKEGSKLISIGITVNESTKIVSEDVNIQKACQRCSLVAGALKTVGPLTISYIKRNAVRGWADYYNLLD